MTLADLILKYEHSREKQPPNPDQLLDYLSSCYIRNELSIAQYRELYRSLYEKGAKKPKYHIAN